MKYFKDQRNYAKKNGKGLMTLSYTDPQGRTVTVQNVICGTDEFCEYTEKFIKMIKAEKGGE